MPELPEVETTRKGITPKADQQVIKAFVVRNASLRWPVDLTLKQTLPGLVIQSIGRRGKYLLLKTELGTLLIHLGMSGNLRVLPANTPPLKHDHVDIVLENGYLVRLNDPRRFGSVLWHPASEGSVETHKLLAKLAPEPLSDEFNEQYFYEKTRNRKVAIKTLVMNSAVAVGAGNIYANESLFMSKIHPQTIASKLTKKQCELLVRNIKTVLEAAIEQGGTTLKDFMSPDGKPGYFVQKLNVYDQGGKPCTVCGTTIERIILNQRASYFCPKCQKRSR
ncbi:bifunctional DNA-formamidopyrimidine glycosylase/DNA-(apurinic or apyrimidinic site) lyase [Thiomicrorhabdus lithotrophica]|uniref:Formamidopyrimidine-DNA glycosylase n=1 Tax=Thiomicrorhabdus lithotrophica TaxID=2949997 RepID=A0ABY8CE36_9GAMM|nr:bifunctional DNA-formamidopyrimidine glycosylase/DNA-(apurinic or apyrimidinic site) lyase [Thiomicrorhabdus lithotrophica]WEJ62403.1 bifunctional DNA-formamidopyrimidine glycosylase/DNA-(apurinic or apyrimidinic site) lyase [Thiomicrorhabdus lithotrophica]